MTISFKSRPVEFHQYQLFPGNVFDLLPEDHECFLCSQLFEQSDTLAVEQTYSRKGQHAYHPQLFVSILIYAYSRGVFSSRQIARRSDWRHYGIYLGVTSIIAWLGFAWFQKTRKGFADVI